MEMNNILLELPDEIQEKFASYSPVDRQIVMNAYLNWHLGQLPDHMKAEITNILHTVANNSDWCGFCKILGVRSV